MKSVKATHPRTPLTLYANGSGGLIERIGSTGVDVVGVDWTLDMADARRRLGPNQAVQVGGVAGRVFAERGGIRQADRVNGRGRGWRGLSVADSHRRLGKK